MNEQRKLELVTSKVGYMPTAVLYIELRSYVASNVSLGYMASGWHGEACALKYLYPKKSFFASADSFHFHSALCRAISDDTYVKQQLLRLQPSAPFVLFSLQVELAFTLQTSIEVELFLHASRAKLVHLFLLPPPRDNAGCHITA